ncbi:Hypothetical protein HDN1F_01420 [gamma proteobacterium HdN1]|nr:Hypothetical protein HDN1F_01420 [gamma proteobacterium HdN1]
MFKNLFKPKWQHTKPEVRLEAVRQLSDESSDQAQILEQVAASDEVPAIRLAAARRMNNVDRVVRLLQSEKDSDTRIKIQGHLMSLLGPDSAPSAVMKQWLADLSSDAVLQLLERTKSQDLGERMLAAIRDEQTLAVLAVQLPLAALRKAAAQRVDAPQLLEEILKGSRSKDKNVYRIVREKLDAIQVAQQAGADLDRAISELCSALEAHSRTTQDPYYAAKFEHLQKRWLPLAEQASADQRARYLAGVTACRAIMEDVAAEALAETTRLEQEASQAQHNDALAGELCNTLETALTGATAQPEAASHKVLAELLSINRKRWSDEFSEAQPSARLKKRFQEVCVRAENLAGALQSLNTQETAIRDAATALLERTEDHIHTLLEQKKQLDKAMQGLRWPTGLALPEVLQLQQRAAAHFDVVRDRLLMQEQQQQDALEKEITKLVKEIEKGNLKAAQQHLRDCNRRVRELPIKKAQALQHKVRELTARVNELRDWQGFATLPKKEALCEQMEALAGVEMDPQALAGRIKRLQDEWRTLGGGDGEQGQALWERFSKAADFAYEPCREYFEKLAAVRQVNLEARQLLCQQLDDYLHKTDWAVIDWRAAHEIFELAKEQWRTYSPVERKAGKDVQDRFNGLLQEMEQRFHAEFEKNTQARRALIGQAESLLHAENLQDAIEKAKHLQQEWKQIGMVGPRQDGKLWKQFRAACDGLFARRDQAREDAQAQRDRSVSEAGAICAALESLANAADARKDAQETAQTREQTDALEAQFEALGPLPREQAGELRRRFQNALEAIRRGLARQQQQGRRDRFSSLWVLAAWLDEQEGRRLTDAEFSVPSTLPEPGALPDMDALPNGAVNLAQQRLKALQQGDLQAIEPVLVKNAETLRQLCLRLELGAGLETPSEDRAYRMQFQINQFNKGERAPATHQEADEQLERLQLEWLAVGPVAVADRERYLRRFQDGLSQAYR